MNGYYIDERRDFFAVLAAKLGEDFSLREVGPSVLHHGGELSSCDVVLVGVPPNTEHQVERHLATLRKAALNPEGVPVVAMLRSPDRQLIREAIAAGAYDWFVETGSMEELKIVLRRAVQHCEMVRELGRLKRPQLSDNDIGSFACADPKMLDLLRFAAKVAASDASILITGETGTGKELLAQTIHRTSQRVSAPFIPVACSALPETLIEAELFGHEKGAFTGATAMRRGRFEVAERGTVFLDEIGDLSPLLQVKLLRVLQERTFERLGSSVARPMQARIICATHRDLKSLKDTGAFRPDLYYRLNTIHIELPPLRERRNDILVLAHSFLQNYAERHQRPARRLTAPVMCALKQYSWPGNVRELQHAIEHAVVLCDGPDIGIGHLPPEVVFWNHVEDDGDSNSLEFEVRTFKRQLIEQSLRDTNNNKVQAARALKISRSSLHRLIEELGIKEPLEKN